MSISRRDVSHFSKSAAVGAVATVEVTASGILAGCGVDSTVDISLWPTPLSVAGSGVTEALATSGWLTRAPMPGRGATGISAAVDAPCIMAIRTASCAASNPAFSVCNA